MHASSSFRRSSLVVAVGLALASAVIIAAPASANAPGELFVEFAADFIEMSAVSTDGATIALSSQFDDTVTLIRTDTNTAVTVADPDTEISTPGGVVFSLDGATLYLANYGAGNLIVIDVETATVTGVIDDDAWSEPWVLDISSSGDTLYIGDYLDSEVYFLDIFTSTVTDVIDVSDETTSVYGLHTSADGSQVFVVDDDGSIDVIDVTTATLGDSWTDIDIGASYGSCVSPDGLTLYQPDAQNPALYSSSLSTGAVLAENEDTVQPQGSEHTACAVSPDGSSVFLSHLDASDPGSITEYDATTLAFVATYDFPAIDYTQQIVFFSDCQAYVVGYDGGAQTFDLDCAAAPVDPDPELAATGPDSAAVTGIAALAGGVVLLGVLAVWIRGRRVAGARSAG